jgi:5-methyltetrahydropteroyltriglutamate--homocysteine methyltransferase
MKRSTDRLLTTHTGSLPRPAEIRETKPGAEDYESTLSSAVRAVVARQVEAGIDLVSDGEMSKPSYATYIATRASGFGGQGWVPFRGPDAEDFPDWGAAHDTSRIPPFPACVGELHPSDGADVKRDIENLKSAVSAAGAVEGFLTAASPGVITMFLQNQYYPTHDAYLEALTKVMRLEYEAIYQAGLTVQVDCPDLTFALGRSLTFTDMDASDWTKIAEGHIEALNAATANIPPDAMRMHLCWGNYEGPHNHDTPLRDIIEMVFRARPAAISFEAANPRHEHEWNVFKDIPLPDDKVLIPGVIDSTSNYVEHPEVVAQRLVRFANVVGRERVIGGSDCGFGTLAVFSPVYPSVAYGKLAALAQGAEIASRELW